jgi:hypothetical protein
MIALLLLTLAALQSGLSICVIALNGRLTAEVQVSLTGRRRCPSEVDASHEWGATTVPSQPQHR